MLDGDRTEMRTDSYNPIVVIWPFLLVVGLAFPQDKFESWLEQRKKQVSEYKVQRDEQIQSYLEERDRLFSEFLKTRWELFEAYQGIKLDDTPKPLIVPIYEPPDTTRELPLPEEPPGIPEFEEPEPKLPREPSPVIVPPIDPSLSLLRIEFLGDTLSVPVDPKMKFELDGTFDNTLISQYWETMAETKYSASLESLEQYREKYRLNDWGYGYLIHAVGEQLFREPNGNRLNLFIWFMLLKSGYDAKIGYNSGSVALLVPTSHLVYDVNYFKIGDEAKYYTLSFAPEHNPGTERLHVYEGNYPDATTIMNFGNNMIPAIENGIDNRTRTFGYNGVQYDVNTRVNQSIVDLYRHFPQIELALLFNAPLSESAYQSLMGSLQELIKGKSEYEAMNMLLRFVQTAFDYQIDQEQFSREKYLIPDETLFYQSSDCEDRSILFAFLVKELLGLKVIGLDYPGHVATAVKLNHSTGGTKIEYGGSRYTVCDPTYINANVGNSMQKFSDVEPKVLRLN